MTDKPKPCPFCNLPARVESCTGDGSVRGGEPFYWVEHRTDDCPINDKDDERGMETGYYSTPQAAIQQWNQRATDSAEIASKREIGQSRDIEIDPYSPDEQRVADWLMTVGIGGGDDPIGFLLASYEYSRSANKDGPMDNIIDRYTVRLEDKVGDLEWWGYERHDKREVGSGYPSREIAESRVLTLLAEEGLVPAEFKNMTIICGQMSPGLRETEPCDGIALRYKVPPINASPEKGAWYGCSKCRRLGQYADFVPTEKTQNGNH